MPIVTIEWYEGRSADQKKEVAEKLTDLLVDVGKTQRDHVWIRGVKAGRQFLDVVVPAFEKGAVAAICSEMPEGDWRSQTIVLAPDT